MDGAIGVGPQPELAEAVQPGVGPLDDPAVDAQAAAVLAAALGDLGLDPPSPQLLAVGLRIVGAVRVQFLGLAGLVALLPGKVWDAVHQG